MRTLPVTQYRGLLIAIAVTALSLFAATAADLWYGGRPDAPALRAAATLLDGPWKFRTGDDPRWAGGVDDSGWEPLDLTAAPGSHDDDVGLPDYVAGYMAHGHVGYSGYAWYRRTVDVPPHPGSWHILGPTLVEDGYELYWNGRLLGGSGRLGARPRVVGTRPLRFALPAESSGTRGVLAIRTFMLPRPDGSHEAGGLHSPPILAPQPVADALYHAQWARTIAGYVVDAVEPLAMLMVAGLAWWCRPRSTRHGFLALAAVALVLTAARRLNNAIVSWTDLMDLPTYSLLAKFMWMPTVAAWAMAWNRWRPRRWWAVDVAAIAILVAEIAAVVAGAPGVTSAARLASIALFVIVVGRIVRSGPDRVLAAAAIALIAAAFFGEELLNPAGVPGIWFPFGIGVSRTQYIYVALIPLIAVLVVRTVAVDRRSADAGRATVNLPDTSALGNPRTTD